ncbi:MAG TPA: signal recognition particle protein [Gammaproteobacteria bacterium]
MFDTLTERLNGALQRVTGRGRITEDNVRDTVRQIRMALLEADVALPVVKRIVERVRQRALGAEVARSLNPGQAFVKIVHDELVIVLGRDQTPLRPKGRPAVLLLVGLQGAGKTTTAGKLARWLAEGSPGQVLLVSTDVHRPAAREQLETIARELGAGYFRPESNDARRIAADAVAEARRRGARWLIVDTAGRLHVDEAMMAEVREVHAAVEPSETLFIVDAMLGQDAVNSAKAFHDALPLTGAILTKADGDARGGAALSVREITGVPIKLIGTGEKLDALEPFVPERFASRILGMGDVVGLVEQVQRRVDREKAERVAAKVKKGRELDLEDYKDQLEQLIGMGGLGALLEKLPGVKPEALGAAGFDDGQLRRQIALINSMTRRERRHPALIDGSRKRRIASGSGLTVQDVNRLLKQHRQLAKTMKRVSKGGFERALGGALRARGGPRPFGR